MTDVLDTDQACEYLKLAKVTLYKHVRSGTIPAFKMGRIWRFQKSALEKWMAERIKDDTNERATKRRGVRG
jgi:excisionase family DNA binding protein